MKYRQCKEVVLRYNPEEHQISPLGYQKIYHDSLSAVSQKKKTPGKKQKHENQQELINERIAF